MSRRLLPLALLLLAALVPWLGLSNYTQRLVNLGLVFALLAISLNLLLGYAGQISLGHAGFFGIGAYTAALLSAEGSGLLFWPGLLLAGVVTGLAGLAIGLPTLRLRGHYLALATLGFGEIMRLLFFNWRDVTHGMDGISGIPAPAVPGFVFDTEARLFGLALALVAATLLLVRRMDASKFGRWLAAIRDAELAAGTCGVNVPRLKIGVFIASAGLAGVAGALYAHMMTFISPDTFSFEVTAQVLSMVVVGGIGTVVGPLLGAFVLTFLPEWLRVSNAYYQLIYGAGLALMIVFLPVVLSAVIVGGMGSTLGAILGAVFMTLLPEFLRGGGLAIGNAFGFDIAAILVPLRETVFGLLIVGFLILEPRGLAQLWKRAQQKFLTRQPHAGATPGALPGDQT